MRQVDAEHVKQQLRQEQRASEAEQVAAGRSEPSPLLIWSVGRLLRVLQASVSATDPLQYLAQYGISRHSVGSVDQRREVSQPTAAETPHVSTTDAVTYSSTRVWITGFLYFGQELDTCDVLELCDSNSRLPSFLLDPSPQLVDQLVLVKRWVLVDKAFGGGARTAGSMFLEVQDENPVKLLPRNDPYANWTQEQVMEVLEANYQTKDPPMYTGMERWAVVAERSRGNGVDSNVVLEESDGLTMSRKHKKRKRVHAVFGRVTSVSPISRQKDRASSHFFVEIERHRSCRESTTQCIANVMFTGVDSMRWNLLLRPGNIVLLTELVKVLSRECEMFLLQATHGHQSGHPVPSETKALGTLKFGESKLKQVDETRSDAAKATDEILSVRIPVDALDWCLLLGRIRGNIDSGDLEVYDRTGSILLCLNGNEIGMDLTAERGVYLFRDFDFMIEDYNRAPELQPEEKIPLVYSMSCSTDNMEFFAIHNDESISFSPEDNDLVDVQKTQEVMFVVTHVAPLPLSSIRLSGLLPEYRVLHGIVCPFGEKLQTDLFMQSACTAEILVSTQSTSCESQQSPDNDTNDEERSVVKTVDLRLHKPHFISVIGLITTKKYYWRSNGQQQAQGTSGQTATIGVKRAREGASSIAEGQSRRLTCILHVRDLQHPDTVEIRVDASRFGLLGTLRMNTVVEFTRLQGFIARSSFKVFLNWSHLTAARLVSVDISLSVPRDADLYGSMPTTFLNDLYRASHIDRTLHRYVVGVMHISYVVLKRKCGLCHQALELNKRRGVWKHAESQAESKYSRSCVRMWQHIAPSDAAFRTRTYMGTTVRCVIDDGSGQADLFLENDVAWELLTCTDGQRRRFEDNLSNYVEELSYFSGRSANGSFATSKAEREQEYYQNELRVFVLGAIPSLRSIAVFAQRFYKAKDTKEGTSVLTFGKDIHLTTKTVSQPKLEAKRVDRLHVRSELQKRIAQLQQREL
ncbi:hypothetical protein PHYPSEUDO_010755 [Phytophthora pseudosyringae]|uniref:CST complex subunit CTC1 n=1 Tax=Phytophthora pseudosyringae TaxID=221518 RepID=A0A8T1VCW6_9STRA|nr:hypothetical protein PHYPSEUDO_010755 [Phytophthora pseudosyringae]